jgi:hypothetical protein
VLLLGSNMFTPVENAVPAGGPARPCDRVDTYRHRCEGELARVTQRVRKRTDRACSSGRPFGIVRRMAARPQEHRSFRIDLDGEQARATCTCGWRSDSAMNAGMAGAMWDKHLEEVGDAAD